MHQLICPSDPARDLTALQTNSWLLGAVSQQGVEEKEWVVRKEKEREEKGRNGRKGRKEGYGRMWRGIARKGVISDFEPSLPLLLMVQS